MLNAERMLNKAKSNQFVVDARGHQATLTVDVIGETFGGATHTIHAGTQIFVDTARGLACAGTNYFEVNETEFTLSFQN